MKILAYCHMYPPVHNAGSEVFLHTLMRGLARRGHETRVIIAEHEKDYDHEGVRVMSLPPYPDVWIRDHFQWSDLAITHLNCTPSAMAAARDTSKPLVHLVHNHMQLDFHRVRPLRSQLLVFNSQWLYEVVKRDPSIIMHPVVDPADYRTTRGDAVLLVSITCTKGALVFYELARRLPDTPFIGVIGAYGEPYIPAEKPDNVTIVEHCGDIRSIYAKTKVVLMPSDYESFGRVAVEAACSGIPSIVSPTDGLKEALGSAGIYHDRDDLDSWELELRKLLNDEAYYAQRSELSQALADSLDPEGEIARLERVLTVVCNVGLEGQAWTVDALGEAEYLRRAVHYGYFDPKMEPSNYRPPLGAHVMRRKPVTLTEKIYLNSKGMAVRAGDPDAQLLLAGPGADIPYEKAVLVGLITEPIEDPPPLVEEEKAQAAPPEIKAQLFPDETQAFAGPSEDKVAGEPVGDGLVSSAPDSAGALVRPARVVSRRKTA